MEKESGEDEIYYPSYYGAYYGDGEDVVTESARACSYFLSTEQADTEKWFLTCWLFKFGCSRALPLFIASKSARYTLDDVKKYLTRST